MVKVAHITTVHSPFDQRIFHRECQSLAAVFDVSLICSIDEPATQAGVKLIPLKTKILGKSKIFRPFNRIRKMMAAYRLAKKTGADVFHIHDPELIPMALHLKRKTNAIVIFDSHEDNSAFMTQKEYIPLILRNLIKSIVLFFEKQAAKKLDAIITADDGVNRKFQALNAKTQTIYNFPRLDFFKVNQENITKDFDLVYHGSVPGYHFKNIFAIDDALSERGYFLKWYVFGNIASLEWVRSEINKRGLPERFVLGERVGHEKVAYDVARAKIGIIPLPDLPKFQSNIPTKLFEYMALGVPVVLSDLPPSRPFIHQNDCAFMVGPSDFGSYAEKIIFLLENHTEYKKMGSIGKKKANVLYNWNSESEKLISFYQTLVGKNH